MEPFQIEIKTLYGANAPAELTGQSAPGLHGNPTIGLDNSMQSVGEVASARHFFAPTTDLPATDLKVLAPATGIEHTTAAAAQAVNQTISPLLQLIMRLPTHISIFSSFLEAIKNFFLPNSDLLSHLANIDVSGFGNFNHSMLALPHDAGWSIMPSHAHIFQHMAFDSDKLSGMARLHISSADSIKHSMNVSAGADLQHPQFEKLPESEVAVQGTTSGISHPSGEALAGPGISAQAVTPQLAPAERVFVGNSLESSAGTQISATNNLLASNQNVVSNNSIAANNNVAVTPGSSLNQAPVVNEITHVSPSQGLHAKALSFASFKGHQHLTHSSSALSHTEANHLDISHSDISHSIAAKTVAHTRTHGIQIADNKIPHNDLSHEVSSEPEVSSQPAGQSYTVKSGDTLWHIAENQLGDGLKWKEIYHLNTQAIGSNPGAIFPGQKFDLPVDLNVVAHHPTLTNTHISVAGTHPMGVSTHIASAPHSTISHVSNTHVPKSEVHTTIAAAHINHPQIPAVAHAPSPHTPSPHTPSLHSNLASMPAEQTTVPTAHTQISVHNNVISNNGLSVQSAHDQLLSGAGSAQASTVTQNPAISKAVSNLVAGKSKSVVSFSLTPDLSFLQVNK